MNFWEAVVIMVALGSLVSIFRARYGITRDADGNEISVRNEAESRQLKAEVTALKERIAVLERLATDDNSARTLDREIEKLR